MEQSITFSDLPTIVIDEIITAIHRHISYDVYLCDLRLVNKQFNEAILHFLAFKRDPRPYTSGHYTSCRRNCPGWREDHRNICRLSECRDHGICNPTYARIHVQARIASERDLEPDFSEFYHTLRKAITLLRDDLARPTTKFPVLRSQLSNTASFRFVSQNPVFNDKISIAFCDAIILVRDLRSKGQYRPPWRKEFVRHHCIYFWLRNLACYLGDMEMLHFYASETCDLESSDQVRATATEQLLGTAAARGHEDIFRFLLPSRELQIADVCLALRGACYSGNASITETILSRIRDEDLDRVCSQPLLGWRKSVRLSPNYLAVAAIIDEYNKRNHERLLLAVPPATEHSSTLQRGRNLVQHSQGKTTVLWPPNRHVSLYQILRYACLNRDIVCFRAILEEAAIGETGMPEEFSRIADYWQHATAANSLSILEEICRFTGKEIHTHLICSTALLKGSVDIMAKQLELDPGLLHHPKVATHDLPVSNALALAAAQLRVENVEFLLQKGARIKRLAFSNGPLVEWRYRRLHEEQFQAVEALLRQYDCPGIRLFI